MLLQTDVAENAHAISAWLKEIETRGFLNYPQLSDQVHNNKECSKSNCEGTSLIMQIIIFTNACMCALKRMLLKRALFMFSDGVDFLVEDPVRGDLLPDEIQTVENLDGKYEDGELKG